MKALCEYSWPGNVRELSNVIERAVIKSQGPILRIANDFQSLGESLQVQNLKTLEEAERDHIIRALEERFWRIEGPKGAAQILGINPSTLRTRMLKLGIRRLGSRLATSPNGDE
jgi:transcriptional regulator of acetoin/glycerol metabolism